MPPAPPPPAATSAPAPPPRLDRICRHPWLLSRSRSAFSSAWPPPVLLGTSLTPPTRLLIPNQAPPRQTRPAVAKWRPPPPSARANPLPPPTAPSARRPRHGSLARIKATRGGDARHGGGKRIQPEVDSYRDYWGRRETSRKAAANGLGKAKLFCNHQAKDKGAGVSARGERARPL